MRVSLLSATSVVALLAVPTAALSQEEMAEREVIIVTGGGLATPAGESAQAASVVDLDTLRDAAPGSLGDVLDRTPGVASSSFGPASGRPVVRGLGGDRVRVLTNGVGQIDAAAASPDHAVTGEALDAERIEILRGASAVAYGGSGVAGVVNIVDGRIPSAVPADGVDGQVVASATDVDDGTAIAGRVRTGTGKFAVQFDASRRDADDYDIPGFAESSRLRALEEAEHDEDHDDDDDHDEDHGEEEEISGVAPNTRYEITTYGAGAAFIDDWGRIGLAVRQYEADYGLPGHDHEHEHDEDEDSVELTGFGPLDEDDEEDEGDAFIDMEQLRVDFVADARVALGPFDRVVVNAGWADYEHSEVEPSGEVGTLFENDGWEARAELRDGPDGGASGTIGVQVFDTDFSALGEEAFVPPVQTQDVALFAARRMDLGGWGWEIGGRVERRDLESDTGVNRDFDTLSGAVGVFGRPSEAAFVGVSLSLTERAPSDVELFADGPHLATDSFEIGDPDLDAEVAVGIDGVVRVTSGGWTWTANAFVTEYDDFIVLTPTGAEEDDLPVFVFQATDARLLGGEVSVSGPIADFGPWTLSGDAAVDWVRARADGGENLPRTPPLSVLTGLTLDRDALSLRAEIEHAADQTRVSDFELPTDGYTLVNLKATASPFDADVRFVLEARNVTDEEARNHVSFLKDQIPLPGRTFRIGVSTTF